jgi:hypothetical protein
MKTYAIIRRNGWKTKEELEYASRISSDVGALMPEKVRWIRSYVTEDTEGLGTVCIYQGVDEQAIRDHALAAMLPVDEVFEVADTVILADDPRVVSA